MVIVWFDKRNPASGNSETLAFAGLSAGTAPQLFESLQAALSQQEEGPVLVIMTDPAVALAWRLQAGGAPEGAQDDWFEQFNDFLKTQRQARRRTTLVDIRALVDPTHQERALLIQRLGAGFEVSAGELRMPEQPTPLALLCATAMIDGNSTLRALTEELRAATIGSGRDLGIAASAMQAWLAAATADGEVARLGAQVGEAQGELAVSKSEIARQREAGKLLVSQVLSLTKELEAQVRGAQEQSRLSQALEADVMQLKQQLIDRHVLAAEVETLTQRLDAAARQRRWIQQTLGARLLVDANRIGKVTETQRKLATTRSDAARHNNANALLLSQIVTLEKELELQQQDTHEQPLLALEEMTRQFHESVRRRRFIEEMLGMRLLQDAAARAQASENRSKEAAPAAGAERVVMA